MPEAALVALDGLGLDVDTAMAVYSTVTAYVHGAVDSEVRLSQMLHVRGWSTREEARAGLATQMTWLMNTGRYPMYARYIHEPAGRTTCSGSSRSVLTLSSTASRRAWRSEDISGTGRRRRDRRPAAEKHT